MATILDFIFYLGFCLAGVFTSIHLWSRVPKLEGKLRKLFLLTGFTFVVIIFMGLYYSIDIFLDLQGQKTLQDVVNEVIPEVSFDIFGLGIYQVSMPGDSFFLFALLMIGLSFYLYPIEKYAKQKRPWHTLSILICLTIFKYCGVVV